jgi:hypothetical protein
MKKFGQPSVQRVYRFASQSLLDTPRPRNARLEVRKSPQKATYRIPKEPSNGYRVGP